MTTDFRALLNAWWDDNFTTDYIIDRAGNYKSQADCIEDLVIRSRAALAEREPEGPTDEEWDALVESAWDKYMTVGYQGERFMYEGDFDTALGVVREKLSRWGRPAPQPADGEVAELVAWLRENAMDEREISEAENPASLNLDRAADLLERLSPPQPVPVSELQAMLDQAMQAAETLRDCWLERTGLTIEDDPFVEDACSTIQSIRSELLRQNRPAPPTDSQLFEEAIACGLVAHIRLAAACHPDKIKLEEVCSPANAALIVFARNVLSRWSAAR